MSWLLEALEALGAGQRLMMGAVLLAGALYLFKVVKIGRFIGSVLSSAATYGIVVLVGAGVAIALGWVDPKVPVIMDQVQIALDIGVKKAKRPGRHLLRWVVKRVTL